MVDWYLGTMGFGYKDWQGVFYPGGVETSAYLEYYSRIFNAVEMDTTFYGIPRLATVERWAASTPDGFKFCAKTPRMITHEMALAGAARYMQEFAEAIRTLGNKLGAILIQLPPSFSLSRRDTLATFLEELPQAAAGIRIAIEFRHRSWFIPQTADLLRSHGICWAATEYPYTPRKVNRTTDFLYIRWVGRHGSYERHNHERVDKTPELKEWLAILQASLDNVETVYGFFNNDYAGFAAGTCDKFKKIAGLPVVPLTPAEQTRLF